MTTDRSAEYLVDLVRELCKLPNETEWAKFKVNKAEPQKIGEYLSALVNSAALAGKAFAYLVWGVEDATHSADAGGWNITNLRAEADEVHSMVGGYYWGWNLTAT